MSLILPRGERRREGRRGADAASSSPQVRGGGEGEGRDEPHPAPISPHQTGSAARPHRSCEGEGTGWGGYGEEAGQGCIVEREGTAGALWAQRAPLGCTGGDLRR